MDLIKSDFLKKQIIELRRALEKGNKEFYNQNKLRLPAVTFCSTFNGRRVRGNLKQYNGLLVIDIDKLTNEEMHKVNDNLFNDDYVYAYWKSPSNKGFKGLISLKYSKEFDVDLTDLNHKYAFKSLSKYFSEKYNVELDKSGSDITRLCFLSYDNHLVRKEKNIPYEVNNSEIDSRVFKTSSNPKELIFSNNKDALYNSENRNDQYDRKLMSTLIRFLNNKSISITADYEGWYKTAMAIANSFTYDVGLNYFTKISMRDSTKYNEIECASFLMNCYQNRNGKIKLGSIIYLANEKGFKTKYQKSGVPKVEELFPEQVSLSSMK